MQVDVWKQTLFLMGLSLQCVLCTAWPARAEEKTPLSYLQYHQEAAKIDEKAHTVDLDRFLELMKQKNTVIADLRSPKEYEQSHIQGAIQFGSDISKENLEKRIPSKETVILLYCAYSLQPVRMIALTHVSLPQFILQGYTHTYKLAPIWKNKTSRQDYEKEMSRLPIVSKESRP